MRLRSFTVIVAGPTSAIFGFSEMLRFGPTAAANLVGATSPTVNQPFMLLG
jgi:hypothetical protein